MFEYIPSRTMKEYLKIQKRTFSDFEKAGIVYHLDIPFEDKVEYLTTLSDMTDDKALKKQIDERIALDKKNIEQFFENKHRVVYTTNAAKKQTYGFFESGELAVSCGKKLGSRFDVEKYQVFGADTEQIKPKVYVNPFSLDEFDDKLIYEFDYNEAPIARLYFDDKGRLLYYYSRENVGTDYSAVCDMFDPRRFENAYIDIPNPFDAGDRVRITETDEVGIVITSADEWQEYNKQLKERNTADFMDGTLAIECKAANGEKIRRNISPIFLERIQKKNR